MLLPDRSQLRGYTGNLARRGFFCSFEGLDGCGKTTQIKALAETLHASGSTPVLAQEPGGTRVGKAVRALLLDSANSDLRPMPELLLYFASRAQNLAEVIRPALEAGQVVLCDRFTDATIAYQGYGRELGTEAVRRLDAIACEGMRPDLTLWLDVAPEVAVERARIRNSQQMALFETRQATSKTPGETAAQTQNLRDEGRMEAEGLDFFQRVRRGYADLHRAEPERVRRVEADGPIEAVARGVLAVVAPLLAERGLAEPR